MTDPYQYYPTPEALSRKAWAMFKNQQFARVLEPSAGEGHLLRPGPYQYGKRLPIDCIEIDIRKHAVLRDEGYAVVGMDFLQFQSGSVYSHVIMNPPFADGAKHVLKAWEILFDGEIVAILNAETVRNPFSKERQLLLRLIEQHGEVEFLQEMFAGEEAERKTPVDVALVWLKKTSTFEQDILGSILDDLRQDRREADDVAGEFQLPHELALPNAFIDNAVLMFNAAVEAARQAVFSEARASRYRSMLGKTLGELSGGGISSEDDSSSDAVKRTLFKRYHDLKNRAWASILRSTQVTSRLSSTAQKRLESDFEAVKSLEFTVPNIYGFLQGIIDQQGEIQLSMVCDVFDLITRYYSDNAVFYMGWKSNDKHRTLGMRIKTTRFVLPGHKVESYHNSLNWESERLLADFDKVFALLDGKTEADVSLVSVFRQHFHALRVGKRIGGSYFDVRYYPGVGTIHFFPKSKTLIDRMNRWVGRQRRWLPPVESQAGQGFWQQFEQAENLDRAFHTEVNKQCPRSSRHVHFDPFWAIKHGGESEREKGHRLLTQAMSTVLASRGIDPDAVLENEQSSLLEWTGCIPSATDLASAS
ncbi:DUF4942 domain-containing protein [Methylomonas sp. MS20]|uniref:DUF4942 domain-containing protein n=1 Tax=unclassified Methylomonas TaxID=2608980 RepID=UPI0028A4358F|nr:DUF4942 domain-containing protein [Methylomonas sp. MV1]MDT4332705.1 DUF4942 domain-containing protein [Methylomonas sp. MV1]